MRNSILILLAPLFLAGCVSVSDSQIEELAKTYVDSDLVIAENFKDIGSISMEDGEVEIDYLLANKGDEAIVIKEMYTSCMCTEARLNINGEKSQKVGMKKGGLYNDIFKVIEPGDTAIVTAVYDPNAHGPQGIGTNMRSVFLETNLNNSPTIELKFQVNVVRKNSDLPDKEVFDFQETEFDFGVIKQSGGVITHDFSFTYNGEQDISIVGIPTSCGCTSAKIDDDKLSKGDMAIIKVSFDPNLHEEPEGRFFKSVNVLTEPTLDNISELKIWAEIDLDLGEESYKLKSNHDEDEEEEEGSYNSITAIKFNDMLKKDDFVLLDVHIPEQDHIVGTDLFIPYDEIEDNAFQLPKDKDSKIVVYCRSGSMSRAAAYSLVEMGYSNVYDLVGGKQVYDIFLEGKS